MRLDVRLPAGLMLTMIGALLAVYGLFGDRSIYSRSLGINVNLIWGAVLIVAGGALLALSARERGMRRRREDAGARLHETGR
jgi:hypothetical protein